MYTGRSFRWEDHKFTMDGYYDPCIILDFGKVITGYLVIDVEGREGSMIDVGYAERLIDGHFVNSLETLHCAGRYILREGRQQFRFFSWEGEKFLARR